MSKTPYIESQKNQEWKNWHKTLDVGGIPDALLTPFNRYEDNSPPPNGQEFLPGLEGLRMIVEKAHKAKTNVRAYGSKWSLNNVAFTDTLLVNSNELNYFKVGIDQEEFVTDEYKSKKKYLCFVQSGVMVKDLNVGLQAKHQALSTSGASDGQTLIGAISTGTHGSAHSVGSMTEYVRGIHLVILGKHVFVQRKSDQAVTNKFCTWLGQAEPIYDDALFNAALVSFGSFGLIHGMLIETEDLYLLERVIKNYDIPDVMNAITSLDMSGLELPYGDDLPFHFEVALNPYHLGVNEKGAFVRVYYKRPIEETFIGTREHTIQVEHDIHSGMSQTFNEDRATELENREDSLSSDGTQNPKAKQIGVLVQIALGISFPLSKPGEKDIRYPGNFFTSNSSANPTSSSPVPATSIELGVPFDQIEDAVDLICTTANAHPFAAPLALRYVKQSSATLGFTGFGPLTVTMEMPGPFGKLFFPNTGEAHKALFKDLANSDVLHRFHWGQQLPLNANWATKSYGDALNQWKSQREKLLGSDGIKLFSNEFTNELLGVPYKNNTLLEILKKIVYMITSLFGTSKKENPPV